MKKTTLVAFASAMALAAQAQYTVEPGTAAVIKELPKTVEYITLSETAIADFEKAGAKVSYIGPDSNEGRNLWYWDGFNAGDESLPRVDFDEGGYVSVVVTGTAGWSGAGFAIDAPGVDLTMLNDNTHFHLAYMTPTKNAPASIGFILLDKSENQSVPAKFSIGAAYDDNGTIYPAVAPAATDEWQGLDITFAQLKKIWPAFSPNHLSGWEGNVLSWLAGNVAGTTIAFDAIYFYNTDESGIASAEVEGSFFTLTGKTLNLNGANGIQLYDLNGRQVKATEGCVLGVEDLQAGVYVAKGANLVKKIVVR